MPWKLDETKNISISDNLDQQNKVLTSAGINWQTFLNLFRLNIVSILLLAMKLLEQNFYRGNFVFVRSN